MSKIKTRRKFFTQFSLEYLEERLAPTASIMAHGFNRGGFNTPPNPPVLTGATVNTVSGTLTETPFRTYNVQFFGSVNTSGGGILLGSTTVTTNTVGSVAFNATLSMAIPPGDFVAATATDTVTGQVSGFSAAFNPAADLSITKVAAPSEVFIGQYVNYTILVTNLGLNTATGVTVSDAIPAGSSFVTAGTTQGTFFVANNVVSVNVGTLPPQASATVTLIVQPNFAETLSNVASVTNQQPDSNPGNDTTPPVLTTVIPIPVGPTTDLAVTKIGPSTGMVGQPLTYTLTVTNVGSNTDPSVTLVDVLPAGTTFVSASIPPVGQTVGNLTFNVGSLDMGESESVIVTVTPIVSNTITNQALVEGSIPDTNPSNNLSVLQTVVSGTPITTDTIVTRFQRSSNYFYPATITLTFSAPLNKTTAQNTRNYQLVQTGFARFRFFVLSARYNSATNTVVIRFNGVFLLFNQYLFTVNGSTSTGVASASGQLIDGAGNGQPGTNYIQTFGSSPRFNNHFFRR